MDITVAGTHEYSVPPERATVHLAVEFEGAEPASVLTQTNVLVNELNTHLEQLRSGVVGSVTWHAVGAVGTRAWRPFNNQGNVLPMRHAAVTRVQAKFRDFEALARFTADWGARDGVRIDAVDWALTEARRTELDADVLAEAVADARRRAIVIARAAGAGDVEPVEIADPGLLSGVNGPPDIPRPMAHAMRAAAGGPESSAVIVPEDVRGSATVHARFRSTGTGKAGFGS